MGNIVKNIKINLRLLQACNKDFYSSTGTKTPMIKLLAFYSYYKAKFKSSHIHYTNQRKIEHNFTSKGTYNKMCNLLVEAGFAELHPIRGIVLINTQYLTDKLCNGKCYNRKGNIKKERWVKIQINETSLRKIYKQLFDKLFLQKINQIRYRVMSNYVNKSREPKGILKVKFAELHKHYDTSMIKLSNKVLGKHFNRSRSFAKKVKESIKDLYAFSSKNINLGIYSHSKYESGYGKEIYQNIIPTFFIRGLYPVKNLGQRMIIL